VRENRGRKRRVRKEEKGAKNGTLDLRREKRRELSELEGWMKGLIREEEAGEELSARATVGV
jgi:hypothetical protein